MRSAGSSPDENVDVRSIGPAESFMFETTAPPALLLPPDIERCQDPAHRPHDARRYELCGDFLFHCHVEMHMMQGLAGLVRSKQTVWLSRDQVRRLRATTGLPRETCDNRCPHVDATRCEQVLCGEWKTVIGSPAVCLMHACLLPNTLQVLCFGYGDTRDDLSRVWDYSTAVGTFIVPPNQPFDVTQPPNSRPLANIWSAEHDFLDNAAGTVLVHGGFTPRETYQFDPPTLTWSRRPPTAHDRFYSTTITLADGKLLTLFGSASKSIEFYNPATGTWSAPLAAPPAMAHHEFYPWTYLLPGGKLFIAGPHVPTQRFDAGPAGITNLESFPTLGGDRSSAGEKGTSVLLPLRPPTYTPQVLIAGGDIGATSQTSELIDLSAAMPAWVVLPNLHRAGRTRSIPCCCPTGVSSSPAAWTPRMAGRWKCFDPRNPAAGWELCATMPTPRGYHSAAILLADGSVLMGGDRPGQWKSGETTAHERYYPSYFTLARPVITGAPATVAYGASFNVQTPSPAAIAEVALLRPGAVTHGLNQSQRYVECTITGSTPNTVGVQAPPNGNVAPPGHYLLFILTAGRVPSIGRWIQVS